MHISVSVCKDYYDYIIKIRHKASQDFILSKYLPSYFTNYINGFLQLSIYFQLYYDCSQTRNVVNLFIRIEGVLCNYINHAG